MISLICENYHGSADHSKTTTSHIPMQFYSLVYVIVSCCNHVLLSQHALSLNQLVFNNAGYPYLKKNLLRANNVLWWLVLAYWR